MKPQLFTIQQFADLHEIGKRTLHFYDEIGLFSPAIKKENGYRYYSLAQGAMLEMILTLRELDMSLDAIKQYMEHRTPERFSELIVAKQQELSKKIKDLKETKSLLSVKQEQLCYIAEDLNSIEIIDCKKKNYAITPVTESQSYVDAMIQHGKSLPHHLFNMELGTMNHVHNLYERHYNHTDAIFSNMGTLKCAHVRPAGRYLRAFHIGNFEDLTPTYERILTFCKKHEITLEGYSYEVGINDLCVMSIDEFVTMIEIKVTEDVPT
ncbi:MerR family transcriptional regulator [Pygmaiobacter massiliensis]|uniref:MerR family transcriptional regulator n=1 Tax=Pygmaiobacter massiliensis TaxID=1917873 RepID=UPI000C79C6D1|nr:MerR family transcriptional regulator [Pygmaiobacter massiliensis]